MTDLLLQTVWFVPCYALVGAMLSALWFPGITRRTGPRPSGYLNAIMTLASFLHAVLVFPMVWGKPAQELSISWLQVAGLDLSIPIEISALTVGAMALITGLNLLAQVFAIGYMELDWGWARFFSLVAFFHSRNSNFSHLFIDWSLVQSVVSCHRGKGRLFDKKGRRLSAADGRRGTSTADRHLELYRTGRMGKNG
jgi:NADH:ubiquinone oxidoreductase subunit 5 (subunit L)/multisubunit Na+/H+ antiporter MnhA subunit